MKGEITINVDERSIQIKGNIAFCGDMERDELVCSIAECLGVETSSDWARLMIWSAIRDKNPGNLEKYEIRIPKDGKETEE